MHLLIFLHILHKTMNIALRFGEARSMKAETKDNVWGMSSSGRQKRNQENGFRQLYKNLIIYQKKKEDLSQYHLRSTV